MSNFSVCLFAVLPCLVLISAGYISQLAGLIKRTDVAKINKIIFTVFLPFLSFRSVYASTEIQFDFRLLIFAFVCIILTYTIATAVILIVEKDNNNRGVLVQGIYRSNFVLFGLPVAANLLPADQLAPVAMLIAITVPTYNVIAVITLQLYQGGNIPLKSTLLSILKNPIVIGISSGLILMALKIKLPDIAINIINEFANVTTPMLLFLLGSFFDFSGLWKYKKYIFWVSICRLVIIPAIILPVARIMGFYGAEFIALLCCFSAPTATGSFAMVQQIGGNAELTGDIVVFTNAISIFTIFLWTLFYKNLGMF